MRRLSPADREVLEALLAGEAECIYNPVFRRQSMPGDDGETEFRDIEDATIAVSPTDVLGVNEEQILFLRFNYCRHRVMRVLRAFRGRRLTAGATRELLRWQRDALAIRTEIVRANTSLVLAMARRSRNSGVDIGELVCEGNIALLRCVDKFDAARGFKFSTYACRAIMSSFARLASKSSRYRTQFPAPFDPTLERSDDLERRRIEDAEDCVDGLSSILAENSAELSAVEQRVIAARFALGTEPSPEGRTRVPTLEQVGASLGVSKERVRQIQNRALRKLRCTIEDTVFSSSS